jgi:hypothetical protein
MNNYLIKIKRSNHTGSYITPTIGITERYGYQSCTTTIHKFTTTKMKYDTATITHHIISNGNQRSTIGCKSVSQVIDWKQNSPSWGLDIATEFGFIGSRVYLKRIETVDPFKRLRIGGS